MIRPLDHNAITRRNWNARDDNHQNFFGRIPLAENPVSILLTWRKSKGAKPHLIGRFELDLKALERAGHVRKVDGFFILRFQRTGRSIEIATNRSSHPKDLAFLPTSY